MSILHLAGIFTDSLSDVIATLLAFTGLTGGSAHYGAILAGRQEDEVERTTAFGFFLGVGLGFLVLARDYLR
ncbi:MAG TPA: hypothetical protein VFZ19_04060 [Solirubrobacterales bacterium]